MTRRSRDRRIVDVPNPHDCSLVSAKRPAFFCGAKWSRVSENVENVENDAVDGHSASSGVL
jgi:hypothetical protein